MLCYHEDTNIVFGAMFSPQSKFQISIKAGTSEGLAKTGA